jgi:hypothetical protein
VPLTVARGAGKNLHLNGLNVVDFLCYSSR